jgi:hypothetical protein
MQPEFRFPVAGTNVNESGLVSLVRVERMHGRGPSEEPSARALTPKTPRR